MSGWEITGRVLVGVIGFLLVIIAFEGDDETAGCLGRFAGAVGGLLLILWIIRGIVGA